MTPSFTTILSTVKELETLFDKAKEKLLNNPTEASGKLAEVLGELSLLLEFIEEETVRFLEIIFLPDKSNFIACRSVLLSLESGYVTVKDYEARGHCHKIKNSYEKYLDRWFSKVLDPNDAQQMKALFERMDSADGDMIDGIKEITHWLKDEAQDILNLVDTDQLDAASRRIKNAHLAIQQTHRDVVEALAQMKLLQASFIVSSQTV
jgi:hypothetical protein